MGKLKTEIALKSSSDQIWSALKDAANLFPKSCPGFKSAEILEGDGKSLGSVILMKYVEGGPATFSKDRIEEIDEANKSLTTTVIEGEITTLYKTFRVGFQVVPRGDGCLLKWGVDYEKAREEVPEPEFIKELIVETFHGIDAYMLKA